MTRRPRTRQLHPRPRGAGPRLAHRRATAVHAHGAGAEGGFAALELAIMTMFVIAMVLLVVGLGRVSHGRALIDAAGSAAARAAALDNAPGPASTDARRAAADTLAQAGMSCRGLLVEVDTGAFHPGGYVAVTVRCTADLSGLALTGLPGSVLLTSTSRSVLETHRDLSGSERR